MCKKSLNSLIHVVDAKVSCYWKNIIFEGIALRSFRLTQFDKSSSNKNKKGGKLKLQMQNLSGDKVRTIPENVA